MDALGLSEAALLVGGGLVAGIVNTLAGGGSLLTVPLLVLLGLPGNLANGTNRVGIFFQCLVAAWRFRAGGALDLREVAPVFVPVALGSVAGASLVTLLDDTSFERAYGVLMLLFLVPVLRGAGTSTGPAARRTLPGWSSALIYLGIGLYAGAFQAGVGIPLLVALLWVGHDLLHANALKVTVIALATGMAVPVFILSGDVAWGPALLLASGFSVGGGLGAWLAIEAGERFVRPLIGAAILAMALRLLGVV